MKCKLIGILAAILLLQGCETASFKHKYGEDFVMENNKGKDLQTIDAGKQLAFNKYSTAFLGKPVSYNAQQQKFLNRQVNFHSTEPVSLATVLTTLTSQTKTSYRINTDIPGTSAMGSGGGMGSGPGGSANTLLQKNSVNFSGSMEEFIRYLSALYDVTLTVTDDNILQADVWHTYTISMDFFGKDNTYEASLDFSGNESTSGGGVKGKSESKFTSTFWDDVKNMVQRYISSGVYNMFADSGVITFSARPSEYHRLYALLKKMREDLSRQFVISYKIYILDMNKNNNLSADVGMKFTSSGTGTTFSFNDAARTPPTSGGPFFQNGNRISVAAKLDALYNLTGSQVLQSGTLVTRNNTPAPLNLTHSENYVSSVTMTRGVSELNVNSFNSEVQTSTIATGVSVIITPRVLSDGRIEITSAFTKKNLDSLDTFPATASENTQQVQLPKVSTTEMFNTVDVSPGTLVMIGKYQTDEKNESNNLHFIGGSKSNAKTLSTVVMVIGVDYYQRPFTENR